MSIVKKKSGGGKVRIFSIFRKGHRVEDWVVVQMRINLTLVSLPEVFSFSLFESLTSAFSLQSVRILDHQGALLHTSAD